MQQPTGFTPLSVFRGLSNTDARLLEQSNALANTIPDEERRRRQMLSNLLGLGARVQLGGPQNNQQFGGLGSLFDFM